jgi:hypothetical protein
MNDLAIITLCRNNADGLRRTLASTARLREIAGIRQYVYDGSDEPQASLARSHADASGVTYVWTEPRGPVVACNLAVDSVKEQWIWCLNSGDEFIEGFAPEMLIHYLTSTSASVATFSIIDEDGMPTRRSALPFLWPPVMTWLCFPATFMRAEALRKVGGLDPSYRTSGDGELWFRLLNDRGVSLDIISVPLVRMEKAGLSGNKAAVAAEGLRFLKKHRWIIFKRWVQSGLRYFEAKRKYRRRLRS